MREVDIMRSLQLECPKIGARLLRNNSGALQDKKGRWVRFGVGGTGGSDLIGWRSVTITPDMVGAKMAIFVACEVKSSGGKPTKEQENFISAVQNAGGIGFVARSVEDVSLLKI
jgi:hypothetical protein